MNCHPRRLAVNCHPPGDPRQAVEIRSRFPESDREFAGGGTVQHMFAGDARGAPLAPKARSWLSRIPLAKVKPPKRTSDSHYRWLSRAFNIFHRTSIYFQYLLWNVPHRGEKRARTFRKTHSRCQISQLVECRISGVTLSTICGGPPQSTLESRHAINLRRTAKQHLRIAALNRCRKPVSVWDIRGPRRMRISAAP